MNCAVWQQGQPEGGCVAAGDSLTGAVHSRARPWPPARAVQGGSASCSEGHTGTGSPSAAPVPQEPAAGSSARPGSAPHRGFGWDRASPPAGPCVSRTAAAPSPVSERNVTADSSDSHSPAAGQRLPRPLCAALCSSGLRSKGFAHLPRYPCCRRRRFPWRRCIPAPSSRSGRRTASCSGPACTSRCHCTGPGSHLRAQTHKVSPGRSHPAALRPCYCADKKARSCRWQEHSR